MDDKMIVNNKKYKCFMIVNTDPTIHDDLKQHLEQGIFTMPLDITTIADGVFFGVSGGFKGDVIIPNTVTSIGYMAFGQNSKITSITIPNSVLHLSDGSFYYCGGLTRVSLGESIQTIGSRCFENVSKLPEITIPSSVENIGDNCFRGCTNLATIVINKPQDSISGAPWGATNATVVWNG